MKDTILQYLHSLNKKNKSKIGQYLYQVNTQNRWN
jgi:hypothetical protein